MQFIVGGPDVPEELLRAHADGRVVFFCGAGISYPAGLPGFGDLVKKIYAHIGIEPDDAEKETQRLFQFDATLDLLGRRVAGQRLTVKRAMAEVLRPDLARPGATDTHEALLQLSRVEGGSLRLVTTNFDRIFEDVADAKGQLVQTFAAPMLPIPKSSRWNGVVYLHGLLPKVPDDEALHRLVVTSGDFGLAYLTERWAARFVSDLFRNYVVCFVGYSINDPVLRYMMDALAADRILGEATPHAYAFADFPTGEETAKQAVWEAKGVVPVLYEAPAHNHDSLHKTLKAWAETYRDGVLGHERIVIKNAIALPSASTRQDNFVGRVLWALSHRSGLPAKQFADLKPVPSLAWLEPLSENRYGHVDLPRFGVAITAQADEKLRFSHASRPSAYLHAPWMQLVTGERGAELDDVMFQLARWLLRHLNDPALLLWLVRFGNELHPRFISLIDGRLKDLARMKQEGRTTELDEIAASAPNAIPGPLMLTPWRLLLTDRVKTSRFTDLYGWRSRVRNEGLTTTLRLELRDLLAPKIRFRKPFRTEAEAPADATRLKQLADWELVLTSDHVRSALRDRHAENIDAHLPALLPEFQLLLRDALDLLVELGEADERRDRSTWDMPSIAEHWQNRFFHDWVTLIDLLRDAWLEVRLKDPAQARRIAEGWFDLPYLTFKRLALFAASQDAAIDGRVWVLWLSDAEGYWLWSDGSQREVMRLLATQSASLQRKELARLEKLILAGPPDSVKPEGADAVRWRSTVQRMTWLRLAKIGEGGGTLGTRAAARLAKLAAGGTFTDASPHQQEEFPFWMSGSGDPDYEATIAVDIAPLKRGELVAWLEKSPREGYPFYEDTWRETCRDHFARSLTALCQLSGRNVWPIHRWVTALQVWAEEGRVRKSWQHGSALVLAMPAEVLQELSHNLAWWLAEVAKSLRHAEPLLLELCRRILALTYEEEPEPTDPVGRAINHQVGHVTNALLSRWFARKPGDGEGLPDDIKPFFTLLCEAPVSAYRNGRVLLAANVVALFRVDRSWTEKYLFSGFNWTTDPTEAAALWHGFLWSPRLYPDLMVAIKDEFLAIANHCAELGDHANQYISLLTYAGLDKVEGYEPADFRGAIQALPGDGINTVARSLAQAQESAADRKEEHWDGRVAPFLHDIWPKSHNLRSPGISDSLARLSIATGDRFPYALHAVGSWLVPVSHPDYVVHQLHRAKLCPRFPREALTLMNAIISDQAYVPTDLQTCLNEIVAADDALSGDDHFKRLSEFARRKGL